MSMRELTHGPEGLVSRERSMPGNNRLDGATADRALSIICERYADFGLTLAREKLTECHGIDLAVETVRTLMRAFSVVSTAS